MKLLANWSQMDDLPGGVETRYSYLHRIYPDSELISSRKLFGNNDCNPERMTKYYEKRYKDDKDLVVIRDAECGVKSNIPQITIFGNPWNNLIKLTEMHNDFWRDMISFQKGTENTIRVANSNFMAKFEMPFEANFIIPNCVDTKFFKPMEKLRSKYNLPEGKIGMWVGATHEDNVIKNLRMVLNLMEARPNVFWILVSKNKSKQLYLKDNSMLFSNVNRETMRELYNCADFFIQTSPAEGCNNSIFEAMSCGLPCIVSPTGYFWDFWDKNVGFQVEHDDLKSHLHAVDHILENRDPRKVIFDNKLDLEHYKEKWDEVCLL
jgi:glycosyltransferase involved in cell wall biosynthesis